MDRPPNSTEALHKLKYQGIGVRIYPEGHEEYRKIIYILDKKR